MEVSGYRNVTWRIVLCHMGAVLTAGILLLIFHWKPRLEILAKCSPCPLAQADWVIIRDQFGQHFPARVQTEQVSESSGTELGTGTRVTDGSVGAVIAVTEEEDWRDTIQLHRKEEKNLLRYYVFEGVRHIWTEAHQDFRKVSTFDEGWTCADLHRYRLGLSQQDQNAKRKIYGPNLIDVPVKSYLRLLVDEVLNPFYIFQVFSIVLWMCDGYYYYAGCIFLISAISIGLSLYETRKQSVTLRNMVKMTVSVKVRRVTGEEDMVNSVDLVPGDCIVLPPDGFLLACDAALLTGECMVNESMLTGESVPEMKTPLPDGPQAASTVYSPEEHKRHTLFCGTQVIQAKSYMGGDVHAVVTRTGFCTAKGDLISSILYPKPVGFKFYRDALTFVLFLGVLALAGDMYSIIVLVRNKVPVPQIVIRALDLITIIVPPALPAAMTVGTIYAQSRLKKHGVFCISPPRINVGGKIKLVCFDKTGTLTEEGLDVWGVVPLDKNYFLPIVHEARYLPDGPLLYSLATCHSVSLLKQQLIGDPMDLKMMESTGWTLDDNATDVQAAEQIGMKVIAVMKPPPLDEQPHGTKHQTPVGILLRFPFSSSLQRMSVVAKPAGDALPEVYMKGAPEMVASLCKPETVPADFSEMLRFYTTDGYRVLGFAFKTLNAIGSFEDAQQLTRDSAESGMTFLGFLVMRNVLKLETTPVIHLLRNANIRTVMVTGDNMLTAVNVARGCRMVEQSERVIFVSASPPMYNKPATLKFILSEPTLGQGRIGEGLYQQEGRLSDPGLYHFALNGKSFAVVYDYFPDLMPKVLVRGTIFARMSPDQKTQLVHSLQDLKYCVGMCGDGANDCGALKAADVGISLSEAEASVASPFTSKTDNIECVPLVIREGRCSLITSFGVFKYMALYSFTQFVSVLILYTVNTNLSDFQFLFFDLIITTTVAVLMGKTGPAKELGPQRPQGTLISIAVLGSLLLQTLLLVIIQVLSYFITVSQTWFIPLNDTVIAPLNLPNYENTVIFSVSGYQYLILAVVMSKGYPFRKPLYTNVLFLLVLIILFALMIWLTLYPLWFMRFLLMLKEINDMNFKLMLLGFAVLNFFTAFLLETALDHGVLNCLRYLRRKRESKKLYKRLEKELCAQPSWPPLNEIIFASPKMSMNFR
ncbi:cation-transporting ATPase 13A2 isoform X2 [Rhinatrema bivittatum]|nr:cation-transporting ATPase 13A2 isoform X2 [Rhinatrema bivittatum]XP_029433724.1 cation-transporting ATPase 13A2 isoform X2 [Rhinatrema bivittatum]XP_029433725.1 cation-transporting ATPase 13A2 isoform X2 [Rhinatrema bivittatum]XP_029433726.1 cation-transporting ATPase 13A2 isoform X2 [Rhinatrema bivittatum]XP_029433727.1 cation-transporting ATPase 13A2 isoform X2 [Rhinatrema bivittatum]XP_029433728.1 cation-transporting ATPase 13A2 isoform X2 [Rhinatrema bivittatum]